MGNINYHSISELIGEAGFSCPNAKIYFYANHSDRLVPIYSNDRLATLTQNPLETDAQSSFQNAYIEGNVYRLVIVSEYGTTLLDRSDIEIRPLSAFHDIKSYQTISDLLDDTLLSYDPSGNGYQVVPGDTLKVAEDGHSFTVMNTDGSEGACDLHTAGGVKLRVSPPAGDSWNAAAFGARGDGSDCANAVQIAVDRIAAHGGGILLLPAGVYTISKTVQVPLGVSLKGVSSAGILGTTSDRIENQGAIIKPDPNGTFTNDFVFFMNVSTDDPSTWIRQYPNATCRVENLAFDATDSTVGLNAFYFSGTYQFSHIWCEGVATLVEKPAADYTDKVVVEHIHSTNTRANSEAYFINLPGAGDGYIIDGVAAGYAGYMGAMTKGVYLGGVRGCIVRNLINGSHEFSGGIYDISALHLEGGDVTINNAAGGRLYSSLFATEEEQNGTPIMIKGDDVVYGDRFNFTVSGNVFTRSMNRRGGWPTTYIADVSIENGCAVTLSNNVRRYTDSGALKRGQNMGIMVDYKSAPLSDFNDYSHILSAGTTQIMDGVVRTDHVIPAQLSNIPGLAIAGQKTFSDTAWTAASGTYYYNAIALQDPRRLAGRIPQNGEVSLDLVEGGRLATVNFNWGNADVVGCMMIRLYRGTESGLYDQYVNIPALMLKQLIDNGHAVNGFTWSTRPAGDIDSMNDGLCGRILLRDGQAHLQTEGSLPLLGTWAVGDEVAKLRPDDAASGNAITTGWYRRHAGTGTQTTSGSDPDWLTYQVTAV